MGERVANRFDVVRTQNPDLGDDPGDELSRSHVKGWIPDVDPFWGGPSPTTAFDLLWNALLNLDLVTGCGVWVQCRGWGGNIEGNTGSLRRKCVGVGSNFVGGIAVGRDPVRTNDNGIDPSGT